MVCFGNITFDTWDCTEKGFSDVPESLFFFSIITGGGAIWTDYKEKYNTVTPLEDFAKEILGFLHQ